MTLEPVPDNAIPLSIKNFLDEQTSALRENYDRLQAYYEGNHRTQITDRMREFLPSGMDFVDNFMGCVVDALVERLNVIGFTATVPDSEQGDLLDDINAWAWDTWQTLRMDATQLEVHTVAAMKADCYVLVAWDNEKDRLSITANDPALIVPSYQNGVMAFASKTWMEHSLAADPVHRLNLYYPERVEKYIAAGNSWRQFMEEGDASWPLPWVDQAGEPLGIPLIHFRNNRHGNDFGTSELHSVIPLQDALNKALIDFVQVNDTLGFQQRYTVNVLSPSDGYEVSPGTVWHMQTQEIEGNSPYEVGQFSLSDPEKLIKSMEELVDHIAGISRTPKHLFKLSGTPPSGEALKVAESGLVHKTTSRMVELGNAWEDVMMLASRVQTTFGEATPLTPATILSTTWDDPETRNEESHLRALQSKMALGIPQRQLWREMGYSQGQIDQMEQDKRDEIISDSNLGAAILTQFQRDGGNLPDA